MDYWDRFALGNQATEFGDPGLDAVVAFIHVQQALGGIEFQAREQQLESWTHELAWECFGQFSATTQAVTEFDLETSLFQLAVLSHMVEEANADQEKDPGCDQQGDHEWCHR